MTSFVYSTPPRCGKIFMQKMKWKFLTCRRCNNDLVITELNEFEEIKTCSKCGLKHTLIKKIRKESD